MEDFIIQNSFTHENGIFVDNRQHKPSSETSRGEEASYWYKHRSKCIVSLIQRWYCGDCFVDVGAGSGYISMNIMKAGYNVTVFEPIFIRANQCKERGVPTVMCGYFSPDNVKPGSVPAVGLFDVLEHIEDDMGFLKSIRELMADEGLFFLTVPAHNKLWSASDDFCHFRRYSLKTLADLINKCGFEIQYKTYIFSLLIIPIFLLKTIPDKIFRKDRSSKATEGGQKQYNRNNTVKLHHKAHKPSALARMLFSVMKFEISRIAKGEKVPFGASCLLVAKKVK